VRPAERVYGQLAQRDWTVTSTRTSGPPFATA